MILEFGSRDQPTLAKSIHDRVDANPPSKSQAFGAGRADMLRRLGAADEAAFAYREALAQAPTEAERRYLSRRLASIETST